MTHDWVIIITGMGLIGWISPRLAFYITFVGGVTMLLKGM